MNPRDLRNIILLILVFSLATFSCQKLEIERKLNIEADSIVNILSRSSIAKAAIRDIGNGVVNYGHCWSTNQNPTVFDAHTDFGVSEKAIGFESQLENLIPNTKYYIRAYANDNSRIYYTLEQSFFTSELGKATLRTGEVRYRDSSTISVVSEILSLGEGVDTIMQYGHCWSATENPTVLDSITNLGIKTVSGEYSSNILGLQALKNYYIKSYAITASGTSYGEQVTAQIYGQLPEVELVKIDSFTAHEIYYSANIPESEGFAIVERGICISTVTNPNKENHGIINGNDNGTYTGAIENLSRATNYFIRAYAVNVNGVAYSNEIEIKTLPELPIIETKEVTDITTNSAVSGGIIIDDGGEELIEKGICWSTEPEPTVEDNIITSTAINYDYSISLTELEEFTRYYIRSYAINKGGLTYGSEVNCLTLTLSDSIVDERDGQVYKIIQIGEQWWMAENLNFAHSQSTYYNYDSSMNANIYGRLYANIYDNVCPTGWHLPKVVEWEELISFLGGDDIAGGSLKQQGTSLWQSPNFGANDICGFNGVPNGAAEYWSSQPDTLYFGGMNTYLYLAADAEQNKPSPRAVYMNYNTSRMGITDMGPSGSWYFAIRCIK